MAKIKYRWDDLTDNIHQETDANGTIDVQYTQEPELYGHVISQRRGTTKSFYHFDGQGSTRRLTNVNQVNLASYSYSAFGETISQSGTANNSFRYQGSAGYYTCETHGDLYVRRRTYTAQTARWLSRDPLGFFDGPNLFAYVANNPVQFFDPSGEALVDIEHDVKEAGCTGCGNFLWKSYLRVKGYNGRKDPRAYQVHVVQRLCAYRREVFCKMGDKCCEIDLEKENRITKCCVNELMMVLTIHDGDVKLADEILIGNDGVDDHMYVSKEGPDEWAFGSAGDGECYSLGHAMFVSDVYVIKGTPDEVFANIRRTPNMRDHRIIDCGEYNGEVITFKALHGPDEIPDDAEHASRHVVGGYWSCCPKGQMKNDCWQTEGVDVEVGIGVDFGDQK